MCAPNSKYYSGCVEFTWCSKPACSRVCIVQLLQWLPLVVDVSQSKEVCAYITCYTLGQGQRLGEPKEVPKRQRASSLVSQKRWPSRRSTMGCVFILAGTNLIKPLSAILTFEALILK